MIGTHSVTVYSDPNAAGWGQPVFTNPYFETDMGGWTTEPFGLPWTWAGGAVSYTSPEGVGMHYSVLIRTDAGTAPRPANVTEYRLRVVVNVPRPSLVWLYLQFGTTRNAAALGPFWAPAGTAMYQWNTQGVEAGQSTVEFTFRQDNPPDPKYLYLGLAVRISTDYGASSGGPYTPSLLSAEVHYRTSGASVDLSCLVDNVTIQHGRADIVSQPDAAAATLELTATPEAPLPPIVDIGAVLVVRTRVTGNDGRLIESTRFTGRISDVRLGWDDAGEGTPDAGVGQIIAVSTLADLGRRVIGDTPWPQELDGARVNRALDLAGYTPNPTFSDPGTVEILPRDVDAAPALDVAHEAAESALGVVWHTRDGEIRYADADHRRNVAVALDLDACDILVTPTWQRDTGSLVNAVSIGYGAEPVGGGDQPRYNANVPTSVDKFGRYASSFTTVLAALADATAMGQLILVRNSQPAWVLSALPLDLGSMTGDETGTMLALDMHDLIRITGLPAIGTAPTAIAAWVEGWREYLAWGVHDFELVISDFCRTSPPPRWNDLDPGWLWDTVPTAVTWDAAACLGPTINRGRWDDQPASLRWDQLNPAMTWDTYAI
jgi:hypothetical protein